MNPNDKEFNDLYYSTDDGATFKRLSEITEVTIHLTEESSAKLWAMIEGLEIVPRDA